MFIQQYNLTYRTGELGQKKNYFIDIIL